MRVEWRSVIAEARSYIASSLYPLRKTGRKIARGFTLAEARALARDADLGRLPPLAGEQRLRGVDVAFHAQLGEHVRGSPGFPFRRQRDAQLAGDVRTCADQDQLGAGVVEEVGRVQLREPPVAECRPQRVRVFGPLRRRQPGSRPIRRVGASGL